MGNPTTSLAIGTNVLNTYGAVSGVSELKAAVSAFSAARNSSTIFRAVSGAEAADIANFGVRNTSGAYETGKLFAPTMEEAARFGRGNFGFDGIPNTIMQVKVPNSVLNNALKFEADGMNAISIPSDQLHLLQATPLNFSPVVKVP